MFLQVYSLDIPSFQLKRVFYYSLIRHSLNYFHSFPFVFDVFTQDIADLALECSEGDEKLEESLASERLGRKVEAMLDAVDTTLGNLERDFVSHQEGLDRVEREE